MKPIFTSLLMTLLIPAASGLAAPRVIDNPAEAPTHRTVTYEELWRAGDDDAADYIFGVIMGVATDDHGNLYLLDSQQQQVFKFTPEGRYLGPVSRQGEGPGEIENVYQMRYLGEGRLGLLKSFPAKLVQVDTTGLPLPSLEFELPETEEAIRFAMVYTIEARGGVIFGQGQYWLEDTSPGKNLIFMASFDAEGRHRHTFARWYGGYDFSRPIEVKELESYQPAATWDVDDRGRLFHTVDRDSFIIEITDADGTVVGRIRRPWPRHRRTDEEKELVKENYSFSSNGDLPPISYDIDDHDPVIQDLKVVGDELWVFTAQGIRQGKQEGSTVVEVFDLEGRLIESRTLAVPHAPREDMLHFLADGRVVRVKNLNAAVAASSAGLNVQHGEKNNADEDVAEDAVLEVIVYRPQN